MKIVKIEITIQMQLSFVKRHHILHESFSLNKFKGFDSHVSYRGFLGGGQQYNGIADGTKRAAIPLAVPIRK